MDDREVELRQGSLLVETKTDARRSRIDREVSTAGCAPMSISKFRLGVGLLLAGDPESAHAAALRTCFVWRGRSAAPWWPSESPASGSQRLRCDQRSAAGLSVARLSFATRPSNIG
jgi:hypothetical protein